MGTVSIPSAAALLSAFAGVDLDAPPLTQMSGREGSHVEAGFYLAVPLMALRRASFTRRVFRCLCQEKHESTLLGHQNRD